MREKLVALKTDIPENLKARFKAKCALNGVDMRIAVTEMITAYVESDKTLKELIDAVHNSPKP